MPKKAISAGVVHSIPADLRKALTSDPAAQAKWEDITPLARNEWICWTISVKKPETRKRHVERVLGTQRRNAKAMLLARLPSSLKQGQKAADEIYSGAGRI